MLKLFVALVLSVSCVTTIVPPMMTSQDERLKPYLNQFLEDLNTYTTQLNQKTKSRLIYPVSALSLIIAPIDQSMASKGTSVAGKCVWSNLEGRMIVIDQDYWINSSNDLRKLVIYHELGHCLLGQPHRSSMLTLSSGDTIKGSLMYPVLVYSHEFQSHEAYYLLELFSHKERGAYECDFVISSEGETGTEETGRSK